MQTVILNSGDSTAEVSLLGGMTTASFELNGKTVSPLYTNPWGNLPGLDPLTSNLRGDFFCLPFGNPPGQELPAGWPAGQPVGAPSYVHGYSSNGMYEAARQTDSGVTLSLAYDDGRIDRVERTVTLGRDCLSFIDTVYPLADFSAPVGFHPIFRLPETARACSLRLPDCREFRTYPIAVDGSSIFAAAASAAGADAVPLRAGGTADITRLPLPVDTEELLLACGVVEGSCTLVNSEENYAATLSWDADMLGNCLFWISNRGRRFAPWSGRNLCLGIEPVASAFDLGEAVCRTDNPLSRLGYRTSYRFTAGKPAVFMHSIRVGTGTKQPKINLSR